MVDPTMFSHIDQRLRQIFDKENTPFGGISVLVVGDFNQKQPVLKPWIFQKDPNNVYSILQPYVTNELWDKFKLLELNEIMRQKDDLKFAQALNRLGDIGLIGLTEEDIAMFNSRIMAPKYIPQIATHIFISNTNVTKYNESFIERAIGIMFWNIAKHYPKGNQRAQIEFRAYSKFLENLPKESCGELLFKLPLKEGCKYMITSNENVKDGLVNGACGILKKYILNGNGDQAVRLYIDFHEDDVGAIARANDNKKERADLRAQGIIIEQNWTPLELARCKLHIPNKTWSAEREQHRVTASEALTVYKVQGSTLPAVALDISQNLQRSDLYVVLSRVTCLANMYLYGRKSIVQGKDFLKYTKKRKEKAIANIMKTSPIHCELRRLRKTSTIIDKYPFLMESTDTVKRSISIMYHNIDGLLEKLPYIKADFGHMSTDILILGQCHTNPFDANQIANYQIEGYTLHKLTGTTIKDSKSGIAIYIRTEHLKSIIFKGDNTNNGIYKTEKGLEIGMIGFKINNQLLYICYLTNHQELNINTFWAEFKQFITQYMPMETENKIKKSLFVVGSLNLNALDSKHDYLIKRMKDLYELDNMIHTATTDHDCLMDWCQTNIDRQNIARPINCQAMLYESCFSQHKPIWLNLSSNRK